MVHIPKRKKKSYLGQQGTGFFLGYLFQPSVRLPSVCLSPTVSTEQQSALSQHACQSPRSLSLSSVPISSSLTQLVPSLLWPPPWLSLPNCLLLQRMSLERGGEGLGKRSVDQEGTHTEDMYFYWGRWEDLFFSLLCSPVLTKGVWADKGSFHFPH